MNATETAQWKSLIQRQGEVSSEMQRLKVSDVKKVDRDAKEHAYYTHEMEAASDSDGDEENQGVIEWAKIKTQDEKLYEKGDIVKVDLDQSQSSLEDHSDDE